MIPVAPASMSIEGLQELANSLSTQCEGFVVTDASNRRVKIKGSEYLRAHGDLNESNQNVWLHVVSAYLFDAPSYSSSLSSLTWKDLVRKFTSSKTSEVSAFYERTMEELGCTKKALRKSTSLREKVS